MHENPFAGKASNAPTEMARFGGENFVRYTGEVSHANQAQLFAWEANRRGTDVHALAEPTKLEMLRKEFTVKKTDHVSTAKKEILEKYGGDEYMKAPPKELLLAQTERYVEYNRAGKVVKGEEKPKTVSKYTEDVYPSNHTSVWGSHFDRTAKRWGFACCRSLLKMSYCTGEAGIEAEEEAIELSKQHEKEMQDAESSGNAGKSRDQEPSASGVACDHHDHEESDKRVSKDSQKSQNSEDDRSVSATSSGSSSSESEPDETEERMKIIRQNKLDRKRRKRQKQKVSKRERREQQKEAKRAKRSDETAVEAVVRGEKDERSLPYNSHYEYKTPSEDVMEEYKKSRLRPDDPMAEYIRKKQ